FQDPSDKLQLQPGYCINFPQSLWQPGGDTYTKSTWQSYGWNENASGTTLAKYQSPASDLLWSDYGQVLVDTWSRFQWTDDLYVRRAIWNDLDWDQWGDPVCNVPDIRGQQTPFTEERYNCLEHGIRHEKGVNIVFMDGHAKLLPARTLREVGPDLGQVVAGG